MGGYKNINEEDSKATQFPHNDPTKGGRDPSIRKQLKQLLKEDGAITIPATQVISTAEDGAVTIKLPKEVQLAMKLMSWAMSKKGVNSIKAIQMIMEQIDGKPKQEIDQHHEIKDIETWASQFRQKN